MHDGTGGGVLEENLLVGIEVLMDSEGGQGRLMKTAQYQLLFTGIGIDVSHGEKAGEVGLELLGIDLDLVFLQLQIPVSDGAKLWG